MCPRLEKLLFCSGGNLNDFTHVKSLCERLKTKFQSDIILPSLTPQVANRGLNNETDNTYGLLNHILLVLKIIFTGQETNTYSI